MYGVTLYDAIHRGLRIPKQVIKDIDQALDYARMQGLYPHDVHGRNVMMHQGRGLVVDISDFLHQDKCAKWDNLKRAYYWLYRPILCPLRLRIPYFLLDIVRKSYRLFSKFKKLGDRIFNKISRRHNNKSMRNYHYKTHAPHRSICLESSEYITCYVSGTFYARCYASDDCA